MNNAELTYWLVGGLVGLEYMICKQRSELITSECYPLSITIYRSLMKPAGTKSFIHTNFQPQRSDLRPGPVQGRTVPLFHLPWLWLDPENKSASAPNTRNPKYQCAYKLGRQGYNHRKWG
jgi:hypothetical protein